MRLPETQSGADLLRLVLHFLRDRAGATAIEYALIAGFLSIGIVAGATLMGDSVQGLFESVASAFP